MSRSSPKDCRQRWRRSGSGLPAKVRLEAQAGFTICRVALAWTARSGYLSIEGFRLTAAHRRKQKKDKKGSGKKAGQFVTGDVIIRARQGDTLVKIAARELGNAKLWHKLAKLNGIRDGRKELKKGRKIKIIDA